MNRSASKSGEDATALARDEAILIVSPRWQTRAMLAAQLGEMTEHDIVSAPDVNEALKLIKVVGLKPLLLIVDVGQEIARRDVERLLDVPLNAPVILIVGVFLRSTFTPLRDRCAVFMTRPVSIGDIAQQALRRLNCEEQP